MMLIRGGYMKVRRVLIKLSPPLIGLTIILIAGTILFSLFEEIPYFDAFYWTIVVISTVGFGDITPQTFMGKILFIILVIFGLSIFGYFISMISSVVTEEKLSMIFKHYFLSDGGRLSNHAIIIGWNEVARNVYEELSNNKINCIVLVDNEQLASKLNREGITTFLGSVDDERTLLNIGIDKAVAAVVTCNDTSSTIITLLKLRRLNKELKIIVSNPEEELEPILMEAGATYVVNSSNVIGRILANYVFEPTAAEVAIDLLSAGNLDLTEVKVSNKLNGKRVSEIRNLGVRSKVIMVSRRGQKYILPEPGFILHRGDVIVLIGLTEDLVRDVNIISD